MGLQFDDTRLPFLGDVLRRRLEAAGGTPDAYLARLGYRGESRDEVGALARELTLTETYFFRHLDQFRAAIEVAIPDGRRARATHRPVRILSAGCASGEEAYTLAILIRRHLAEIAERGVVLVGIDINTAALDRARRARYPAWSLRETPPDVKETWFREESREFALAETVRKMVTFEERNLLDEDPSFWQSGVFDVIFCRNVLMYLAPEAARAIVGRISPALDT